MEIEEGDYVRVVGKCETTAMRFKIVKSMEKYINSKKEFAVTIPKVLENTNSVMIEGYRWDIKDLHLIRKNGGPIIENDLSLLKKPVSETSVFKFDEKTLDI